MPHSFSAIAMILTVTLATDVAAETWIVDADKSNLGYEILIGGASATGTFQTWTADIRFDPLRPEEATVEVDIDMMSVSISDPRAESGIGGAAWLNIDAIPNAVFSATGFDFSTDTEFSIPGMLILRGVARPVTLSGTLEIDGDFATVSATATFNREIFDIGVGQDAVGKDVRVIIDLVAERGD